MILYRIEFNLILVRYGGCLKSTAIYTASNLYFEMKLEPADWAHIKLPFL